MNADSQLVLAVLYAARDTGNRRAAVGTVRLPVYSLVAHMKARGATLKEVLAEVTRAVNAGTCVGDQCEATQDPFAAVMEDALVWARAQYGRAD
jgi:hypothetical protein